MQEDNETTNRGNGVQQRGRLAFYHPNGKGSGTALQIELRLQRPGEKRQNCMFFEMARQKTTATRDANGRTPATFDWAGKATVKMDVFDLCELLAVLEGRCAQAGGARDGLYHESGGADTIISFKRCAEPAGYLLGISRRGRDGAVLFRGQIVLSEAEAIGLRCVLQASLFPMTLGAGFVPRPDAVVAAEA